MGSKQTPVHRVTWWYLSHHQRWQGLKETVFSTCNKTETHKNSLWLWQHAEAPVRQNPSLKSGMEAQISASREETTGLWSQLGENEKLIPFHGLILTTPPIHYTQGYAVCQHTLYIKDFFLFFLIKWENLWKFVVRQVRYDLVDVGEGKCIW